MSFGIKNKQAVSICGASTLIKMNFRCIHMDFIINRLAKTLNLNGVIWKEEMYYVMLAARNF